MACRTLARACSRSSSLVCMGIPHQSQHRYTKQYAVDRGLSSGSCSPDETATLLVVADTPVLVPSCPAHPSSPTPSGAARLSPPSAATEHPKGGHVVTNAAVARAGERCVLCDGHPADPAGVATRQL